MPSEKKSPDDLLRAGLEINRALVDKDGDQLVEAVPTSVSIKGKQHGPSSLTSECSYAGLQGIIMSIKLLNQTLRSPKD